MTMWNKILVSSLKFIAIIVLATLFVSTISVRQSEAKRVKCPCNYLGALGLAKSEYAGVNIDECVTPVDEQGLEATGGSGACQVQLEATDDMYGDVNCGYEIRCDAGDIDTDPVLNDGPYLFLKSEIPVDPAQFDACINTIEFIAEKLFHAQCP